MLRHFIRAHWLLFVSLLFLTAVALTVLRLWIPTLGNYQQELEAAASEALKRDVSIGKLEATWRGIGPVLKLKDISIAAADETQEPVDVDEVWIRIDVEHFIAEREVRASGIDVIGAEIGITRAVDGRITIDEFDQGADGGGLELENYLKISRLSVNDSIVWFNDLQSGEAPYRFSDVTLAMHTDGNDHSLSGYMLLPPELGYRVDVIASLQGEGADFRNWHCNAYLKGQVLAMSGLVRSYLPDGMIVQGIADLRLWMDYSSAQLQSLTGELDAHSVQIENPDEAETHRFSADVLRGRFGWRQAEEGWQLALQDLSVSRDGITWGSQDLSLSGSRAGDVHHIRVVSSQLHLDGLGTLPTVFPDLAMQQREQLHAMRPTGAIDDLQLALEYSAGAITLKRFSAGFHALGIRESVNYPAVSGLAGKVAGTPEQGSLTLSGSTVEFNDSRLFQNPLAPMEMHADISWQDTAGILKLESDNLQLENRDLALHGSIGLDVPGGGLAPSLYLQLAVDSADIGQLGGYLPDVRMRPKGVAWLRKSLVSGSVTDGSILVDGRVDRFPFDQGEGRLEVRLPVKNAAVDYNKRWSPVIGVNAQVDIDGRSLNISSSQGAIRNAMIRSVQASIPDLAKPVLALEGSVNGSLPVMLAELDSSPLGEKYGGFVDRVRASGQANLDLDLDLVLYGKNRTVKVSGKVGLDGNELAINESNVVLKKITGTLEFDEQGIRGENLTTELYDRPANARVWSDAGKTATHVSLEGKLDLLRQVLARESPLYSAITGESDWRVLVSITGKMRRDEKANISLRAGSMLAGTAIDLPSPLGKDSAAQRELSIDIARLDFEQNQVRLKYGDQVNGLLSVSIEDQKPVVSGGEVMLGGDLPQTSRTGRLLVSGRLPLLSTSVWKPYLESDSRRRKLPVDFNLAVDRLELLGHYVRDVSLDMKGAGVVWNIKAGGPSVSGDIQLRRAGGGLDKVVLTLERLVVNSDPGDGGEQATAILPASFPDLQIVAQQFTYDDIDLGNFQLTASKKPVNTYEIARLALSSDLLDARLSGSWQVQDGEQRSTMDAEISKGKMDDLLKVFGFQQSMAGGSLSGSMRVAWAGPPWAFSPPGMEGQINMLIEKGQLVDIEPGAAGRIMGLLSLNNIRRRLVLDFSDLFGEGFSFDRIEGSFVVDSGNAYTSDLIVNGPAAKIDITGRVGLADQDYDQLVTVTPTVRTPLGLAGTVVGGPVVGAAIMVAETLLEGKIGPLNKMVRTRYSITGPWSKPEIRKIGEQDSPATAPVDPIQE